VSPARRKYANRRRKPARDPVGAVLRRIPPVRLPRGRAALVALAGLAACGYTGWAAADAYARGALLTVSRVEVTGNRHWQTVPLLEHAGLDIGPRLHEIPFRAARKRLLSLPGIEAASIRYLPGGRLRVSVREAEVVAIRRTSAGWRGMTPSGEWMPLTGDVFEDAPVLEGRGLPAPAERAAAAWLAAVQSRHPDVFAGFSQFSPRGAEGEADVYWRDGRVRLWVDYAAAGAGSLEFLRELLRREGAGWPDGATVDLRVEGYAYVR
jgi:hypothetical protein